MFDKGEMDKAYITMLPGLIHFIWEKINEKRIGTATVPQLVASRMQRMTNNLF